MKGETMHDLKDLVPPLELCKLIPAGEFADSVFIWGYSCDKRNTEPFVDERDCVEHCRKSMVNAPPMFPAPTFDEILDELHKCQEDVFVKWSETAYHGWLVNAYSHGKNEDYQVHDEKKTTAALKVWLQMKGIKYAE
jgi:hypothetical protein